MDVNIVVSNEPALGKDGGQNELDGALGNAAGAVKSWPPPRPVQCGVPSLRVKTYLPSAPAVARLSMSG
jgi:hypothetical protein